MVIPTPTKCSSGSGNVPRKIEYLLRTEGLTQAITHAQRQYFAPCCATKRCAKCAP